MAFNHRCLTLTNIFLLIFKNNTFFYLIAFSDYFYFTDKDIQKHSP